MVNSRENATSFSRTFPLVYYQGPRGKQAELKGNGYPTALMSKK